MSNSEIKVLIVDDDVLICEMIQSILEELDYVVLGRAANGTQAIEKTLSLQPDVILLDLEMPGMDGIEAAHHIASKCPTPVVALTAYDSDELVARASEAGIGAYLLKPPNFQEIDHAIKITLARYRDMIELRELNAKLQAEIVGRRRAEATADRLAALNKQIKALLAERERTQQQLIQSEKMSALGRLTATIAHEINNPIQAIQGCLSLCQEEISGESRVDKLSKYLEITIVEVDRVADLIARLKTYYRPINAGLQPIYVNTVIEDVLDFTRKTFQDHQVSVSRFLAEGLPVISANSDHLKQVFLNIILNSIDAMPEGGHMTISTESGIFDYVVNTDSRPLIKIVFRDTGIGLSPEALSRIFEPFFTNKDHGSGLGLYISYEIVKQIGGKILVDSQVGKGTTFTLLFPVIKTM